MNELDLIIKLQQSAASPGSRLVIGFLARWLVYFLIPFALLARRSADMKTAVYEAMWTALVAFTISTFTASLIGRVRPFAASSLVQAVVPPNIQAGSFPSSHTAVAFGVAIALLYVHPSIGIFSLGMALLIAFGRIMAGMHYPTDILGGIAVGVIAFAVVRAVHRGIETLT